MADFAERIDYLATRLEKQVANDSFPVRFDHCFKRIAFDVAAGGQWDKTVPSPFYRHASEEQLMRAIEILNELENPQKAHEYNSQSLKYRGHA